MRPLFNVLLAACAMYAAPILTACEAKADSGRQIVYFDCERESLYLKMMTLYDVTPVFDGHTFDIEKISPDQKKLTCRISPSVNAIINLNVSRENSRDNNVNVLLNEKLLANFSFEKTNKTLTYIIKNLDGDIRINSISGVEIEKRTTTHFAQK